MKEPKATNHSTTTEMFYWFQKALIAIPVCDLHMANCVLDYIYGTWWRCRGCGRYRQVVP